MIILAMINISKGPEPRWLGQYRRGPTAGYDAIEGDKKKSLLAQLLREQGYLCAYCMGRIDAHSAHIEHVASRKEHEERELDYANMLAVCPGNEGAPPREQHCDESKGGRTLINNPADMARNVQDRIRYSREGEIVAEGDAALDDEINQLLNLNLQFLKNNRKAVVAVVRKGLSKLPQNASAARIAALLARWRQPDKMGKLPAYAGVAIYFLEKRLRKARGEGR